jgi:predicted GH43/DUF377 family glycosyl hydrolase
VWLAVRSEGRLAIYDGMADRCIGVARASLAILRALTLAQAA